jgi:hypothetical protein
MSRTSGDEVRVTGDGQRATSLNPELVDAIDGGDLDEVVRLVDGLCVSRDWDAVVATRDRCRAVIERGLQMWPAAEYAEYRLALEAPASYAGLVVVDDAGRFALGPLWEVAASTHAWADLAGHVPMGPARTLAAYERGLRGDDPTADQDLDFELLDLPFVPEPWEPRYEVAEYKGSEARFPAPEMPRLAEWKTTTGADRGADEGVEALLALVAPWGDQSNGTVAAALVNGTAEQAVGVVAGGSVVGVEITPAQGLARMAWAGASGGAYGRRRGSPMGRFAAWWAASVLTGNEWPADPDDLGEAISRLRWVAWEPVDARPGWSASVAIEDREAGRAWALLALDSHREGDDPAA